MECIFCKIIRGELPCYKVYEDEYVMAFLDINPLTEGHTLVVPKKHYERITDIPEEELKGIFKGLQNVLRIISKLSEDYNVIVNQGVKAGQIIKHLHFHIIPRYGKEEIFLWNAHRLTEEEAKKVLEKIKE